MWNWERARGKRIRRRKGEAMARPSPALSPLYIASLSLKQNLTLQAGILPEYYSFSYSYLVNTLLLEGSGD